MRRRRRAEGRSPSYADGIGPDKRLVDSGRRRRHARCRRPTSSQRAHAAGLLVHIWTIRIDKEFLPPAYDGHAGARSSSSSATLGVDGIFTDFPDVAARSYGARGTASK